MAERALVTGGAGFIGSHVVDSLVRDGYEVLVVDDLSAGDASRLAAGVRLARVDITDAPALADAFDEFRPGAVFHLAAQASVTASVNDPGRDCAVNVLGTLNVAEAARKHAAPLVFTSTGGALYGDDAPIPTAEDRLPLPLSPYGASKLAAEAYVRSWSAAHGVPNAVMRLGNIYGPRQTPHGEAGVVAIFSGKMLRGEPVTVNGDGKQTRDYVYVGDVARMSQLALETDATGPVNVGTGIETDVNELAAHILEAAKSKSEVGHGPAKSGEQKRSVVDIRRAADVFTWKPEVSLREGLARTVEFFRAKQG